jgi:hypothetical protein
MTIFSWAFTTRAMALSAVLVAMCPSMGLAETKPETNFAFQTPEESRKAASELAESMMCELKATTDGSMEELRNRQVVATKIEAWRKAGLLDTPFGAQSLEVAMRGSGCAPVAEGQTVCETLENHRYSGVNPECRELLLFEDRRFEPIRVPAPDGARLEAAVLAELLRAQMIAVYPTLSQDAGRDIPGELSWKKDLAVRAVVWVLEAVGADIVVEEVREVAEAVPGAIEDYAWSREAEDVITKNSKDLASVRYSQAAIEVLEKWKAAEKEDATRKKEAIDQAVDDGEISKSEAEVKRAVVDRTLEKKVKEIDDEITDQEANITTGSKEIIKRSEEVLKKRGENEEDACEKLDCIEFEIDIGRNERYQRELRACQTINGIDPTIVSVDNLKVAPDLGSQSKALVATCSAEQFERMMSGFLDRIGTVDDRFGTSTEVETREDETVLGLKDPDEALQDAIRHHEGAFKLTPESCQCQEAEARLGRAMARKYPQEDLQADIMEAYWAQQGGETLASGRKPVAASDTLAVSRYDICERKPLFIFEEDDKGTLKGRLVLPEDEDYPDWAKTSALCGDDRWAPFKSDWERANQMLRPSPKKEQTLTQDMIEELISKNQPLGTELMKDYRPTGDDPAGSCKESQAPGYPDLRLDFD